LIAERLGDNTQPEYSSVKQNGKKFVGLIFFAEDDHENWEDWDSKEPEQDMFNEISKTKKKKPEKIEKEIDDRILDKSSVGKPNLKKD
jgi:hypothetical protein